MDGVLTTGREKRTDTTLADPTIDGLFGGHDADRGKKQSQCSRCLIENYQLVTKQWHSNSPKKANKRDDRPSTINNFWAFSHLQLHISCQPIIRLLKHKPPHPDTKLHIP